MSPSTYSRQRLIRDARLRESDLAEVARCRTDTMRLGFAYQIAFVRLFNRFPTQHPFEVEGELAGYVAMQLGLSTQQMESYASRRPTVSEHQARIRKSLHLRSLGKKEAEELNGFLLEQACRLEQTAALEVTSREYLKSQGILVPADYALRERVGEQRKIARGYIFGKISEALSEKALFTLEKLLEVEPGEAVSDLQRLKANPGKASPDAMLSLLEKLRRIEASGILAIDLSWLNGNYQRSLFHYVRKCSVDRLREVNPARRHTALVCFLHQSYRGAIDQSVDMFDKIVTRVFARAKDELDEQLRQQRRDIQLSLGTLQSLGEIILDETVSDDKLREALFEKVPRDDLEKQVDGIEQWVSGKKSDVFHAAARRWGYFRRFAPAFLEAIEFAPENDSGEHPCLKAVEVLRDLNADRKRKLPEGAPREFIPKRLQGIVEQGGRQAWECALLEALRGEIRSGNLYVRHSKRFARLEDFFTPPGAWRDQREAFLKRAALPTDPGEVAGFLESKLAQSYDLFLKGIEDNRCATIGDHGWHLSPEPPESLDGLQRSKLDHLKAWLRGHMRSVKLPELLIEVDNDLGFTRHFLPASQRGVSRNAEDVRLLLAAILAHGCNIGPHTMAHLIPGISYKQLKRVSDWQLTEDTQRLALAGIVNAISRLDATQHWGEGRTSASDGQRFGLPRKVLQQTYSTKFSDFALEFYSFVADNFAPFHSDPIECTDRDAAHVLDGLLYNESDLDIEEHYMDTHGYTEVNFAAFAMLGKRFCPRIRNLKKQRIYRIDEGRDYGPLQNMLTRSDRTINTRHIVEQWDRIAHFYSSLEAGHATASVALRRLVASSGKNQFARANRDLERIFKTEFILRYMSEPELRTRIRRGLLKVDQLHALAHDVYYGRRGRINAREIHGQMNSCSCLVLLLACIIYWQAREITRVTQRRSPEDGDLDLSLLKHVSPIEWENIVLYGEYFIDVTLIR